jgi:hypothetical protein
MMRHALMQISLAPGWCRDADLRRCIDAGLCCRQKQRRRETLHRRRASRCGHRDASLYRQLSVAQLPRFKQVQRKVVANRLPFRRILNRGG